MKKIFKINFVLLLVLVFGSFFIHSVLAEDVIQEEIIAPSVETTEPEPLVLDEVEEEPAPEEPPAEDIPAPDTEDIGFQISGNIVLKNGCTVEDKDGGKHIFPEVTGPEYLAVCALQQSLEEGLVENIEFVDFGFGLFVNSVNETTQENTYWKLNINDVGASVGASQLELGANDTVSLVLTAFDPTTFEETSLDYSVTLAIDSLNPTFNNITLFDHCSVLDSEGVTHEFPEESSPSDFLAICALFSAKEAGKINDFVLVNSSFGLYVQSVNGEGPSDTEYWALWLNGEFANCGVVCLPMVKGDILSLILSDWMDNTESTNIKLRVINLTTTPDEEEEEDGEDTGGSSGGGGGGSSTPTFSVPDALSYLKNAQNTDGSFGDDLYTDWAAIAYGAGNVTGDSRDLLIEYFNSHNNISSLITDNERRAIALLSLGENPYSFHGKNYIHAITEEFDGTQFGDEDLVNDDIFALIPLFSAGYDEDDDIILKDIDFIVGQQNANGSWEESVDITAAAIQALIPFDSIDGVTEALEKAETYLKNTQASDGGWQNISSTSWAMQAEAALGGSWGKNGKSGMDYLAAQQDSADNGGAVLPSSESGENVIWATSYAIPAGLGKPWSDIMESFSKPEEENNEDGNSNNDSSNNEKEGETAPILPVVQPTNENETVPVLFNASPVTKQVTVVSPKRVEDTNGADLEEEKDAEIPTLTATVTNALPEENKPVNLPIILGAAFGLIFLYFAFKFFV